MCVPLECSGSFSLTAFRIGSLLCFFDILTFTGYGEVIVGMVAFEAVNAASAQVSLKAGNFELFADGVP